VVVYAVCYNPLNKPYSPKLNLTLSLITGMWQVSGAHGFTPVPELAVSSMTAGRCHVIELHIWHTLTGLFMLLSI
jgi:hypothetical protein